LTPGSYQGGEKTRGDATRRRKTASKRLEGRQEKKGQIFTNLCEAFDQWKGGSRLKTGPQSTDFQIKENQSGVVGRRYLAQSLQKAEKEEGLFHTITTRRVYE